MGNATVGQQASFALTGNPVHTSHDTNQYRSLPVQKNFLFATQNQVGPVTLLPSL